MATANSVIDTVLTNEGGFTNDPADGGGPTAFGISQKSNPEAWKDGPPTAEEARQIYLKKYMIAPGFTKIKDAQLQAQLVDFAVHSGPGVAIMKLQGILHVPVDGVLGPETLAALEAIHPEDVSNLLAKARVKMLAEIVVKNPSQLKFLVGWLNRALEWIN